MLKQTPGCPCMALPAPDPARTLSSPCLWCTVYLFPRKKKKKNKRSHGVILSSRFPHSIAFRGDFQMVLEKKKATRHVAVLPRTPGCKVGWGSREEKWGLCPISRSKEGGHSRQSVGG